MDQLKSMMWFLNLKRDKTEEKRVHENIYVGIQGEKEKARRRCQMAQKRRRYDKYSTVED